MRRPSRQFASLVPCKTGLLCVTELVEELRIELPGEDVDDSTLRASDARAEREYERRADGVPAEEAAAIAVQITEKRAGAAKSPPGAPHE